MARNAVKSSSQDFSKSVHASVPRSVFYRPSTNKTTFDAGKLVPIYIDEILPGDTYKMRLQHVARLITPITPTMDNVELEFFAFFVPNRIVWTGWEELNGENKDSAWIPVSPPAGVPHYSAHIAVSQNLLGDYYGLPIGMYCDYHSINLLPFRGYRKIWNDWFRNQNVQAPLVEYTGDSAEINGAQINMPLQNVNKPFDYFTSCLPAPQKGESQLIPVELNDLIPVITSSTGVNRVMNTPLQWYGVGGVSTQPGPASVQIYNNNTIADYDSPGESDPFEIVPKNLWADGTSLGNISNTTISDLRTAFQIQKLFERDARGGTRYVEMLKAHFGVEAGDYRLQRPEYLGHLKTLIGINQVAQTSETGTTPQANLAAYGHSQGNDMFFEKSFVEHGFLHIFAVARQKKTYQQGLARFWTRQDRLDYYLPVLAHISEQPVMQSEIYALSDNADVVFGYNEAWSDYRYKPSMVTAQMRSDNSNTFEIWHYADKYASAPLLSDSWMQDNSYTNILRTLAVQDSHQIKLDVRFDLEATRPIPVNSIPGMIDHF
jgi:hypothetical protein